MDVKLERKKKSPKLSQRMSNRLTLCISWCNAQLVTGNNQVPNLEVEHGNLGTTWGEA